MVFYSGFPFGHIVPVPYYAQISYTLPNGTVESEFAVSPGPISFAQTTPSGYSSGSWPGIGGFLSTESGYIINFQGESVSGEIIMDAVAPPHYPCSMYVVSLIDTSSDLILFPGLTTQRCLSVHR